VLSPTYNFEGFGACLEFSTYIMADPKGKKTWQQVTQGSLSAI
jgi:hypothetical protein